ncbi:Prenylcysteine lyase-domain-containing protein, partial [Protomyces lactucae-debilis]
PHIAIIGAGAGGSSAAYKLSQGLPSCAQLTVFEANDRVGGRSTTVNIGGADVELGASIFVEVNKNLISFAKLFNLTLEEPRKLLDAADESSIGIFDGHDWRWKEKNPSSSTAILRMLWKYGLSPKWATRHVSTVIEKFIAIYDAGPFEHITKLIDRLDLLDETRQTAQQGFKSAGVSKKFLDDFIQAATRVNYAQDLRMHGVLGCVSFVTESPSFAVKGGNWRIFEALIKHSKASLRLQTRVCSISRQNTSWVIVSQMEGSQSKSQSFDYVLVATPLALSNISIIPAVAPALQPVEYVTLHVTLITTSQRPSTRRFGKEPPMQILTTTVEGESLSLLSFSAVSKTSEGEYIYKVFSSETVTQAYLTALFDLPIPDHDVFRHVWQSYPKSVPTEFFDQVEVAENLFYANSFERWISTMETATIAGMNAAALI